MVSLRLGGNGKYAGDFRRGLNILNDHGSILCISRGMGKRVILAPSKSYNMCRFCDRNSKLSSSVNPRQLGSTND